MSKFLRKTEFEKVILALWNSAKNKFIEDIAFDTALDPQTNKPKNTLKKTINGQPEEVINHVVTEWMDLEYTSQSSIKNIFDKNTQVEDGKYFFVGTGFVKDGNWCTATIPCNGEERFTIVKMSNHDSGHMAFLDENMRIVGGENVSRTTVNGKIVYKVTIPNNVGQVAYFTVNIHKQTVTPDKVMIFSGHIDDSDIPTNYVPFTDGATVLIDSSEVALSFDGTGTNLSSSTIHSAIKELDGKIANAGGGTVTSVNGELPQPNGDVELVSQVTQTVGQDISLQVGNQNFATLECMTDQEANDIINGFTL